MKAFVTAALLLAALPLQLPLRSGDAVAYRFSFPEARHHWMEVRAEFRDLERAPLHLRMSRTSPGRYSTHDFAKNVYDVEAYSAEGRRLAVTRPDPHGWAVPEHPGAVTVRYRVFGARVDGTYLAVDTTHAHLNMPAAVMWARGLEDRPIRLAFEAPAGTAWTVATQLPPGEGRLEFTAPNLQYLMDSPAEFGPGSIRQFVVDGQTIRFAAHHTGSDADLDAFMPDVRRIVEAERDVFGELPRYDQGTYTFLADYLPYASADGMEHRNSTVISSQSSIRSNREGLLDTVAHEFFHGWNVERIRPQSLEPFDLERANMSGELWLAEGFTQYYGPLAMSRAGVSSLGSTLDAFTDLVRNTTLKPGRAVRSAEDMSRMAVFTDGGRPIDRTNWSNTFISYYPFGGGIALALDLSLRSRFENRVTLDDFMRAMWRVHGKPAPPRPGFVAHPYTSADAEARLAEASGDPAFARDFFARYISGREAADYAALLARAGIMLRRQNPGRAWWGDVQLQARDGLRVAATPDANTPLYEAGLDIDDQIRTVDGTRTTFPEDVAGVLRRHRPGDAIRVEYVERGGAARTTRVTLVEDPRIVLVPVEEAGGVLPPAQRAFRGAWLGPRR